MSKRTESFSRAHTELTYFTFEDQSQLLPRLGPPDSTSLAPVFPYETTVRIIRPIPPEQTANIPLAQLLSQLDIANEIKHSPGIDATTAQSINQHFGADCEDTILLDSLIYQIASEDDRRRIRHRFSGSIPEMPEWHQLVNSFSETCQANILRTLNAVERGYWHYKRKNLDNASKIVMTGTVRGLTVEELSSLINVGLKRALFMKAAFFRELPRT